MVHESKTAEIRPKGENKKYDVGLSIWKPKIPAKFYLFI